jgi:deoxycytidine triphosphate deaminase
MYLSNREIKTAIDAGELIFDPPPKKIDETSVDLHLDRIDQAAIWDIPRFTSDKRIEGVFRPELRIGQYDYKPFSSRYTIPPPDFAEGSTELVQRRLNQCMVHPGGFLLWQTRERVGTPEENANLICFVDGKSTRARSGIVVHLTAPTIHAGWSGNITLEIVNLGPFDLVLQEGDVIAQLTVARISSCPDALLANPSVTSGQSSITGH